MRDLSPQLVTSYIAYQRLRSAYHHSDFEALCTANGTSTFSLFSPGDGSPPSKASFRGDYLQPQNISQ